MTPLQIYLHIARDLWPVNPEKTRHEAGFSITNSSYLSLLPFPTLGCRTVFSGPRSTIRDEPRIVQVLFLRAPPKITGKIVPAVLIVM
jgi:hypothetical protein